MKKKKKEQAFNDSNKQALSDDIANLQIKVRQTEMTVTMMDEEAFECMRLTERKSALNYVNKGNDLKSKSEKLKNDIVVLEKETKCLEIVMSQFVINATFCNNCCVL